MCIDRASRPLWHLASDTGDAPARPDDWTALMVPHFYMGPLPAFFHPAFQLMDYGVHSWDIRESAGRAHGLSGEVADLLVPFMFVLWQATASPALDKTPTELGIRITSGPNAGNTRVRVSAEGSATSKAT